MKFKFRNWTGEITRHQYNNGRTALIMNPEPAMAMLDPSPIAVITVNLPDFPLGEDEILVKSYSENLGMIEALIQQNLVTNVEKIDYRPNGFPLEVYKCKYHEATRT